MQFVKDHTLFTAALFSGVKMNLVIWQNFLFIFFGRMLFLAEILDYADSPWLSIYQVSSCTTPHRAGRSRPS